jgi:hypothetical protein
MFLKLRSKGVRELVASGILLIEHMIRRASLIAAVESSPTTSESQDISVRRSRICGMCVAEVTLKSQRSGREQPERPTVLRYDDN